MPSAPASAWSKTFSRGSGRRPLAEIEPPELLACLRRVEARGAIETAHRVKYACGQVFTYGIATGQCKRNSAADLRDALQPVRVKHHAAITDPKRVGELLRAMAGYQGHAVTRAALAARAAGLPTARRTAHG